MAPQKPPKVSTSDFLIAFGPGNSYLARAPGINRSTLPLSQDLSKKLVDSKGINFIVFPPFEDEEPTLGTVDDTKREAALEEEPRDEPASPLDEPMNPYVSYSRKGHIGDSKLSVPSDSYIPSLGDWLKDRWGTGGLQVVANGKGGWWGLSSSGTTKWVNLPRDVRQLLKPYHPHGKVVHLALGIHGTYVVLFDDGHVDWDLKGCYDVLDAELEARGQGELVYASLSTYKAEHFLVAFNDATVLYELPPGTDDVDEDFLAAEALRVIVPSETAKHTGLPISKTPSALRDFSTSVLKGVTENAIENTLS